MLRDQWQFRYSCAVLADAAKKKKEYHASRLQFWRQASAKVMLEVRESGIEVSVSEAGSTYSNMSRGMGPQVMVRNDLQRRLTECHEKVTFHDAKVREFEGWFRVLSANINELALHAEDYLYFFDIPSPDKDEK